MRTDKEYLDKAEEIVRKYHTEELSGEEALNQLVEMFKVLWD